MHMDAFGKGQIELDAVQSRTLFPERLIKLKFYAGTSQSPPG